MRSIKANRRSFLQSMSAACLAAPILTSRSQAQQEGVEKNGFTLQVFIVVVLMLSTF